ncbi:hypothetical protein cce_4472 [Crocosphaera subtropica ATCC 51142]|uniref:Uncharacterized protein n=1 Tax=Crocosphaera subtropica (strain ATCC 51142 / BH68) TaxID=43989 RepID=B1WUG6_CROS5|nr:hypothetical protein [Crocosphaera subtropica]ACB53820.1 hypothetical protein cce_4472 [Crocosphaera subtropica ATCC 51142]
MIKLSIKIITIASLTVGLGLYFIPKNGFSLPSRPIKSIKIQNNIIPVALPYDATVTLKTNSTMSGKIVNFDQQKSEITVEKSGRSKAIAITDIEKVEFGREVKLIHSGKPVIRGEDNNANPNTTETWQEPLTHFKITNAQDGKAEVILSKLSKAELRGIRAVSQTNTYVVDELSFNDNNNHIILTVIRYSD